MAITKEDVADLRPGDVVEFHDYSWPEGHTVTGPLYLDEDEHLCIAGHVVRFADGYVTGGNLDKGTLTVISRAPRPLYVNHDRTEPVDGDIVRDCDGDAWCYVCGKWWCAHPDVLEYDSPGKCQPLTLLWDGETGEVVR